MVNGIDYKKLYEELLEEYEKVWDDLEKYHWATLWQRIKFLFTGEL